MSLIYSDGFVSVPVGILQIPQYTNISESQYLSSIKLSLVLPTYNEGENIRSIITILCQLLDRNFNRKLAWNAIARAFDGAPKR
jgi:hypothetical protein